MTHDHLRHPPTPLDGPVRVLRRAPSPAVALESTVLAHGVPRDHARRLAADLANAVTDQHAHPAFVGVLQGIPIAGMSPAELESLLVTDNPPKLNTANLGIALARRHSGATTVSTTCEIAALAGIRVVSTGGIGGVHRHYADHLDISADLPALARFPVAVVASGVKSILDVIATREALESLGVPVVGFATDRFPAFYERDGGTGVDARFDDVRELARFVDAELARTGRGILIANPVPEPLAIAHDDLERWLALAAEHAADAHGRDATPAMLGALHRLSDGRTLAANLALLHANARLAGRLAAAMTPTTPRQPA